MNDCIIESRVGQRTNDKLAEHYRDAQKRIMELEQALAVANAEIERQAKQITRLRAVNAAWQRCVEGKPGAAGEPAVAG